MKKFFVLLLSMLFAVAIVGSAFAGDKTCGSVKTCTTPCPMSKLAKKADVTETHTCTTADGKKYDGKCSDLTLTVKGMTDIGGETKVKSALTTIDGVIAVQSISHADNSAVICFDPDKISQDKLAETIKGLGYEVEIAKVHVCQDGTAPEAGHSCPGHTGK